MKLLHYSSVTLTRIVRNVRIGTFAFYSPLERFRFKAFVVDISLRIFRVGFGHDVHAGDALEWDDRCEGLSESG